MVDQDRTKVLTDAQWKVLAPLIETCRPPHKTEHHDLRRTVEAIIWRHDNGAKWRQLPADLGPWWIAAQCSRRWARLGARVTTGSIGPAEVDRMLGAAEVRLAADHGWLATEHERLAQAGALLDAAVAAITDQ